MENIAIVGLGNFGDQYKFTRHNVGFLIVDEIKEYNSFFDYKTSFKSQHSTKNILGKNIHLLKPQTYMNLSGEAVLALANFYKILPENIIVVQDDLDMEFGKIRYKTNSSDAGHNGIKDIQKCLGKNIHRIKIGIGRGAFGSSASYVLSNFNKDELIQISEISSIFAQNIDKLITKDFNGFINCFSK